MREIEETQEYTCNKPCCETQSLHNGQVELSVIIRMHPKHEISFVGALRCSSLGNFHVQLTARRKSFSVSGMKVMNNISRRIRWN